MYWLPQYYRRFNAQPFAALVAQASQLKIPTDKLLYRILGCGVLFQVRARDVQQEIADARERFATMAGTIAAQAFMNNRTVRQMQEAVKKAALVIGPESRALGQCRKPGPLPDPAPRIAALLIYDWISQERGKLVLDEIVKNAHLDPLTWACNVYQALSKKTLARKTFDRYYRHAEQVQVTLWLPDKKEMSAMEELELLFASRYRQFKRDGFPIRVLEDNPLALYPISLPNQVLRAVDLDLLRK